MCYGIIYKIENKINGKIYIGQTTKTFDERYGGNIRNTHNKHLKRSIEKCGIENFDIDKCVCTCETKEELDKVEQFYIYVYDAANPEHGYNLTFGGEGGIPNEETRKKISKAKKGKYCGEKNPMYGKNAEDYMTEEAIKIKREKQSKALSGEKHPMYNKHHSQETKQKISEAKKGKYCGEKSSMWGKNSEDYMTPEAIQMRRKKISEANSGEKNGMWGKHLSEETKKKISEAKKGKYCGENSYMYGKHLSEETKKKISEAKKGKYCGEKSYWYGKRFSDEHKQKLRKKNKNSKSIVQLDKNGSFIQKWDYIGQASRELNIACQHISTCCKGRKKSAGGYIWMYEEDFISSTTIEPVVSDINTHI